MQTVQALVSFVKKIKNLSAQTMHAPVSFVKKKKKKNLPILVLFGLVSFWIKKKLNKSSNAYMGSIIQAFLSFSSFFPYISRNTSQKVRPLNIFLKTNIQVQGMTHSGQPICNRVTLRGRLVEGMTFYYWE